MGPAPAELARRGNAGFGRLVLLLYEYDVRGAVGFLLGIAVFIALGLVDAGAKTVVRAVGMRHARRCLRTFLIRRAVLDAAIATFEFAKANLARVFVTLAIVRALGAHAELIGFVAASACGWCDEQEG